MAGRSTSAFAGVLTALRPRQWVKNLLVVVAPLVALGGGVRHDYAEIAFRVSIAFVVFCLAASAIYLVNDARDIGEDRVHPVKRHRPIAAGTVSVPFAYFLAAVLAVAAIVIALATAPALAVVMAAYLGTQLAYCFGLKHHAVLDICIVSSAYLLRAIAGAAATDIRLSKWFLLVMAFASLFMVAGKRYAELQLTQRTGAIVRRSLNGYTDSYLRFVWTLSAIVVVVCYALWAFERDDGTGAWFVVSMIPFTVAILRYAIDIDSGLAGAPEDIALRDRVLQVLGLVWLATVGAAILHS
ncbi:MAG: decaprenyl-phosphate phosphoribosyltransferase [Mycobacterium sp.]|nr:decaprenyl-phosphate phosphoribosyltransferase [Mycobacterium sp.]